MDLCVYKKKIVVLFLTISKRVNEQPNWSRRNKKCTRAITRRRIGKHFFCVCACTWWECSFSWKSYAHAGIHKYNILFTCLEIVQWSLVAKHMNGQWEWQTERQHDRTYTHQCTNRVNVVDMVTSSSGCVVGQQSLDWYTAEPKLGHVIFNKRIHLSRHRNIGMYNMKKRYL